MMCFNCSKLSFLNTKKTCIRCQGEVFNNLSVLCEHCSSSERQCSICLKKIISQTDRNKQRGCNCGRK